MRTIILVIANHFKISSRSSTRKQTEESLNHLEMEVSKEELFTEYESALEQSESLRHVVDPEKTPFVSKYKAIDLLVSAFVSL
jgi:hypothetical protein